MKPVTFPPILWLSFLVPAAAWVQETFPFPEYWWSPGVVIALGAIGKAIQVYWPQSEPKSQSQAGDRGYLWTSRAWRFWIGG